MPDCKLELFKILLIITILFLYESEPLFKRPNLSFLKSTTPAAGLSTENPFESTNDTSERWLDAIRDVAYYLRGHKFNEYDRRYHRNEIGAPKQFFGMFPRPPLRSLHWEVHKFCEQSFKLCVEYLQTRIKRTDLRRSDDTVVIMELQNWTVAKNLAQITAVEMDCKKLLDRGEKLFNPFEGPLERFQWRTTASYYMCWFTMHEVRDLQHLNESCDNFASCFGVAGRPHNEDARASDTIPFNCATYSFCPDPCCPLQHLRDVRSCHEGPANPCYETNTVGQRECIFRRQDNLDFRDIVLNRWNVSCRCPRVGYIWDSRYGICVDVDECAIGNHTCDLAREACVNLLGMYECVCRWGYHRGAKNRCVPSAALDKLKLSKKTNNTEHETKLAQSIVKQLFRYLFHRSAAYDINIMQLHGYLVYSCVVFVVCH